MFTTILAVFRRRVILTVLGAALFGGIGATVAVVPFHQLFAPTAQPPAQAQARLIAIGGNSPTSTATRPTSVPSTTPTSGNQLINLYGSVQSVNTAAETFVLRQGNGTLTTVVVSAQTQFQGTANSLSGMQTGWRVQVKGAFQSSGAFAASLVNTTIDT